MGTWFSASAIVPAFSSAWVLDNAGRVWLTMSVQTGFVAGSLISALLNLADRIPSRHLFAASAFLAALSTVLIPLVADKFSLVLILRFLTGLFLVGVYPVGMKIMATWIKADRGLGFGLWVGALTRGSASPHLLQALVGLHDRRRVLFFAVAFAVLGGLVVALFI